MTLPIPAGSYDIDTAHSQLGFAIRHLGISTVRGTFDAFSGSLTVGSELSETSVVISADMTSVNTGNEGRDGHLHGEHFFDSGNHPKMTFTSTAVEAHGDDYVLHGDLTIRGITKPIALATTFNGTASFPMDGSTHFGFEATGQLARTDFGVSYGVPLASDTVKLTLDVQFVQPAA